MKLRKYRQEDSLRTYQLFYETVHTINKKDYTKNQLNVWAPPTFNQEEWCKDFSESETIVAEINRKIVGVANLNKNYLDKLYIHKDFQNQNIATKILKKMIQIAKQKDIKEIITHSSITAKTFFEQHGFTIIKEQIIYRQEIALANFIMQKNTFLKSTIRNINFAHF